MTQKQIPNIDLWLIVARIGNRMGRIFLLCRNCLKRSASANDCTSSCVLGCPSTVCSCYVSQYQQGEQIKLALVQGPDDMRLFEYSVLVTNLDDDLISLMRHYRDRADCENNFDETKNQWGGGGFVPQQLQTSQIMARIVALVYNGWNLFVRLAIPHKHHEAITSRPLLLSSVGWLTESGRQRRMVITSTHGDTTTIQNAYAPVTAFFTEFKSTATQWSHSECWRRIVAKSMEVFMCQDPPNLIPQAC